APRPSSSGSAAPSAAPHWSLPPPAVRSGLDFGPSNTSLAVADGESARVLAIDEVAGATMPTILYVRRDGSTLVGRPAIDAYLGDERARGPVNGQVRLRGG